MEAPFDRLFSQAFPSGIPAKRREPFGCNVDVCVGLSQYEPRDSGSKMVEHAHLNRIKHFNDARMSKRS